MALESHCLSQPPSGLSDLGQGASPVAQAERAADRSFPFALREGVRVSLFGKSKSGVCLVHGLKAKGLSFSIFNPELFLKVLQFGVVELGEKGEKSKKTKNPQRHR